MSYSTCEAMCASPVASCGGVCGGGARSSDVAGKLAGCVMILRRVVSPSMTMNLYVSYTHVERGAWPMPLDFSSAALTLCRWACHIAGEKQKCVQSQHVS
jgi:hypothetical protein